MSSTSASSNSTASSMGTLMAWLGQRGEQNREQLLDQQHATPHRMARQRGGQQPQQELDLQHRGRLRRMAWPAWQQHREQQLDLQQYRRLRRMDSNSTASSNSTISMDAYVASRSQLGEQQRQLEPNQQRDERHRSMGST
ncbi:hypothetical protein PR003_g27823 [Phytophthora rubi]|uniref:Uncharacterized protein n=1 Tax=Phytophthora rubi TaxID=129364 RepID=A0A6A3M209_9STRA|nr:hypothetical protein PR001_g16654 [Phytophthora rubi]KAE9026091.1 hypothetical protein PR002_g11000 [Phytophthora rubi]KAE9280926.1 hypothetical protein PR003_g27823 [Phytophthora rubi]